MAIDYGQYQPLLNFLGQKAFTLLPTIDNDSVSQAWLSDPGTYGLYSDQAASYNPYFRPEIRDFVRNTAKKLGLTEEDADRAALNYAQSALSANGGQALYSEASSPYIVLDDILNNLYHQAGKPYTPLTPEQHTYYAGKAEEFQQQVKAHNQDQQDADDLTSALQIASVFAGPVLGGFFGDIAAADAGAGAGADAAGAGSIFDANNGGIFNSGIAGTEVPASAGDPFLDGGLIGKPIPGGPLDVAGLGAAEGGGIFNSGLPGIPMEAPAAGLDTLAPGAGGLVPAAPVAGLGGLEGLGLGGVGAGAGGLLAGAGAGVLLNSNNNSGDTTDNTSGGLLDGLLGAGGASLLGGAGGLGGLLGAGLGFAGSYQQTEAFKDLANKYMEMGAPYRDKLNALYTDPNTYLHSAEVTTPVQMGTDALAKSLSVKGNPFGSGTALQGLQDYATKGLYGQLQAEKDRLANYGGLAKFASAAPGAATSAINASGGMYNAAGYGLGALMNPTQQPNQNAMLNMLGLA